MRRSKNSFWNNLEGVSYFVLTASDSEYSLVASDLAPALLAPELAVLPLINFGIIFQLPGKVLDLVRSCSSCTFFIMSMSIGIPAKCALLGEGGPDEFRKMDLVGDAGRTVVEVASVRPVLHVASVAGSRSIEASLASTEAPSKCNK